VLPSLDKENYMNHRFRIVADPVVPDGFRVFAEELMSREERLVKARHLREMGWGWPSIANELNTTIEDEVSAGHAHDYGLSADYVLTVIEPGDIVITPWREFIVQKRGRA
jgi:hypothetical protein